MRKSRYQLIGLVGVVAAVAVGLVLWLQSAADDQRSSTAHPSASTGPSGGTIPSPGRSGSATDKPTPEPTDPDSREIARSDELSRLLIPRLGVDAPIYEIGMVDRTLVPPDDPSTVGWWRGGPEPGAPEGSALIIGHTEKLPGVEGTGNGALGHISRLRVDDRIEVRTRDGLIRYRVTEIRPAMEYDQVAEKAPTIYDRDYPGGRLVLITCWSNGTEFTGNTFVFAEPV